MTIILNMNVILTEELLVRIFYEINRGRDGGQVYHMHIRLGITVWW